jgi:hypothetical protein
MDEIDALIIFKWQLKSNQQLDKILDLTHLPSVKRYRVGYAQRVVRLDSYAVDLLTTVTPITVYPQRVN